MQSKLLRLFNEELSSLKQKSQQFARAYPQFGGRLALTPGQIPDPHVEQLTEGFALIAARIRNKIEDEFPELSDALLNLLYPHYQLPFPAATIVEFKNRPGIAGNITIPPSTPVEMQANKDLRCIFSTCYPVTLIPLKIFHASLSKLSPDDYSDYKNPQTRARLQLKLDCLKEDATLCEVSCSKLRFYISAPSIYAYKVYQLLFSGTLAIAISVPNSNEPSMLLAKDCLKPVGFSPDEGLLPYPTNSLVGYRLLTEFFAFPEKFLFFELDLRGISLKKYKHQRVLQLDFYLDQSYEDIENHLDSSFFKLGCTPLINLFEQHAEPIKITHTEYEYQVIPDARKPDFYEIYIIKDVRSLTQKGGIQNYSPVYKVGHSGSQNTCYWSATRNEDVIASNKSTPKSDVYISFINIEFNPTDINTDTVSLNCLMSNHSIPSMLQTEFECTWVLREAIAAVGEINCIKPVTRSLPSLAKDKSRWPLISHLNLNYLSLSQNKDSLLALKELLSLYNFTDSDQIQAMLKGITDMKVETITKRIAIKGIDCVGIGTSIHLVFNDHFFKDKNYFLLASILELFFSNYCTINTFCQLEISTVQQPGVIYKWPARAGDKILL